MKDTPTKQLAQLVADATEELASRTVAHGQAALDAAWAVWPELQRALKASGRGGRGMGLGASRTYPSTGHSCDCPYGPCFPEWASEPVVSPGDRRYDKPKNKAEAVTWALTFGDHEWRTIGELWLWVGGGGPIVTRALQMYGYGPIEKVPAGGQRKK